MPCKYGYTLGFITYMVALGFWPEVVAQLSICALAVMILAAAVLAWTDPRNKAEVWHDEGFDPEDPYNKEGF